MKNVLVLKSSILGTASQTNEVVEALQAAIRSKHPQALQVVRDLAVNPLPHLEGAHLAQAPQEAGTALAEVQQADVLVIGAPMYNFSVPSTLKAWIDHIAKAGVTFKYTEQGPVGLLTGKRAILVVGSGGVYSEGPYAAADFVVPYLKTVLGFLGIAQVEVLRVEGVAGAASTKGAVLDRIEALAL